MESKSEFEGKADGENKPHWVQLKQPSRGKTQCNEQEDGNGE